MTRRKKLEQAIVLLREVEDSLCIEQTECDSCGRKTWIDWDQRNVQQALHAATNKVVKGLKEMRQKGIQ